MLRVEKRLERGAYHALVPGGAYYVDGVLASTYIAHVPLGAWKTFADGYATLRYKLGVPLTPEGVGPFTITWPLKVYRALGVPPAVVTAIWPLTTAAAVVAELANTVATRAAAAAPTLGALLVVATTLKSRTSR